MTSNKFIEFQNRIINLYVEHPEVKRIWNMLDSRRRLFRRCKEQKNKKRPTDLFVMGKSRVGKTLLMEKYAKEMNKPYVHINEEETEIDIVEVAYMELPTPFTLAEFYQKIIQSVHAPRLSSGSKVGELKHTAFKLLKEQRVEMLIIDEMDHLLASTNVNRTQAMETIKSVSNEAGVILVCVGTPQINSLRTLSDQFIARYSPVTIPWFKECDEKFIQLLQSIEEQLVPEIPLCLADAESAMPALLHELTGGLIGWLYLILYEAFELIGVMDSNFDDFSILNRLDGDILIQARDNVVGELDDDELNRILERNK